jgi:hypothetical protein
VIGRAVRAVLAAALAVAAGPAPGAGGPAGNATLGPQSCQGGNCHVKPNRWWPGDDHNQTVRTFFTEPKYAALLGSLGIGDSDFAAINSRCMTCHGTVRSDAPGSPAEDGVSCESCHGPAGAYLKPHQEKGQIERAYREFGLRRLEDAKVRGKVCVACHYIPEKTLIDAAHPAGWGVDEVTKYTTGVQRKIAGHWEHPPAAGDTEGQPYLEAINLKGYPPPPPPAGAAGTSGAGAVRIVYRDVAAGGSLSPLFFPERPLPEVPLAPVPEPPDSASAGRILILLQERLTYLYGALDSLLQVSDD